MTTSTQPELAIPLPITPATLARLQPVDVLASLDLVGLQCFSGATELHFEPGHTLVPQGASLRTYWILLEGSLRISQTYDGHEQTLHVLQPGTSFGETTLLANLPSTARFSTLSACTLVALDEPSFWNLMQACPKVREAIVDNLSRRLAKMQSASFQQEKMASLGTLAAGLMHELNNPGAAARRASSQLRTNLMRLHELAARFTRINLTPEQKECVLDLQRYALNSNPEVALSTIEQTDAEEALAEWMESVHVEDSWKLAPTLVAIGIDARTLSCARSSFDDQLFSDALNWLEALVSSMQLVGTIEESISRITDLVHAVKSYAYEGRSQQQAIDLNHSIHATLVILAHKLREKQILLQKDFAPNLPPLAAVCQNLNQVWTNLLDNAIDAVPQGGRIQLQTWLEAEPGEKTRFIGFRVEDNGAGIPLECQSQIFDPFFTTKPVGVGTGLGLGIVYRIVEQCGGTIHFTSVPGSTAFVVRLPAQS